MVIPLSAASNWTRRLRREDMEMFNFCFAGLIVGIPLLLSRYMMSIYCSMGMYGDILYKIEQNW